MKKKSISKKEKVKEPLVDNNDKHFSNSKSPLFPLKFWPYIKEEYYPESPEKQYQKIKHVTRRLSAIFPKINNIKGKKYYFHDKKENIFLSDDKFLEKLSENVKLINPNYKVNYDEKCNHNNISDSIDFYERTYIYLKYKQKILHEKLLEDIQNDEDNLKFNQNLLYLNIEDRLDNLTRDIYRLQMQQFAESISRIFKCQNISNNNSNLNYFKIKFDPETKYKDIILNEKEKIDLLSYREAFHCPNICESFIADDPKLSKQNQELILRKNKGMLSKDKKKKITHEYKSVDNNNNSNHHHYHHNSHNKKKESSSDNINYSNNNSINYDSNPNINSKNNEEENYKIGSFQVPNYNFCHHCKLKKQPSDIIKCNYKKLKKDKENYKNDRQVKVSFVNSYILLQKEKNYLLKEFDGDVRELIDEYFSYKRNDTYSCNKYYCIQCLKQVYEIKFDNEEDKKKFICPSCNDHCSCSRCFRKEQLIKLISCYITLNGDLNKLYKFLREQNSIMIDLDSELECSKFIVFDMKDKKNFDMKINKDIKINNVLKYKGVLEKYNKYFSDIFSYDLEQCNKLLYEYELLGENFYVDNSEIDNDNNDNIKLLKKKRKRINTKFTPIKKQKSINIVSNNTNNNSFIKDINNNLKNNNNTFSSCINRCNSSEHMTNNNNLSKNLKIKKNTKINPYNNHHHYNNNDLIKTNDNSYCNGNYSNNNQFQIKPKRSSKYALD